MPATITPEQHLGFESPPGNWHFVYVVLAVPVL